jgi:hypothetical protein
MIGRGAYGFPEGFFFLFLHIGFLWNLTKNISKINQICNRKRKTSQFLCQKIAKFTRKKRHTAHHQAFIKQGTTYVNLGVHLRIFKKLFNGFKGEEEDDKNNFNLNPLFTNALNLINLFPSKIHYNLIHFIFCTLNTQKHQQVPPIPSCQGNLFQHNLPWKTLFPITMQLITETCSFSTMQLTKSKK